MKGQLGVPTATWVSVCICTCKWLPEALATCWLSWCPTSSVVVKSNGELKIYLCWPRRISRSRSIIRVTLVSSVYRKLKFVICGEGGPTNAFIHHHTNRYYLGELFSSSFQVNMVVIVNSLYIITKQWMDDIPLVLNPCPCYSSVFKELVKNQANI